MQTTARISSKTLLLLLVAPAFVVAFAQQTIPLTRSSCTNSGGPVISCHWSNSAMTCTYNATSYLTSQYTCNGSCASSTEEHGAGTKECMLVTTTKCCANNIEMDSSCSSVLSATMTQTTTSVPCC